MEKRKLSAEHRQRISESKKGKPGGRRGCSLSEEHKKKISVGNTGKVRTQEMKDRMRDIHTGMKYRCRYQDGDQWKTKKGRWLTKENGIQRPLRESEINERV